jgi:hypothetical protein
MAKKRNPILVIIFWIVTIGIYGIYWLYSTKKEMVELGAKIPTYWLIIIPIVNIYWLYKYSLGTAQVAKKEGSMGLIYFILWIVFSPAAIILTQIELNKLAS